MQPLPLISPHRSAWYPPGPSTHTLSRPERAMCKVAGRFCGPRVKHLLRLTALRLMEDCGTKGNANSSHNYKFNITHNPVPPTCTPHTSNEPPSSNRSVTMKINENKLVEFFCRLRFKASYGLQKLCCRTSFLFMICKQAKNISYICAVCIYICVYVIMQQS